MKTKTYVIIGLLLVSLGLGYYFIDYQNKPESVTEPKIIGISKEKVLLSDQNQYDLDIVLNSMISNQIVLQNSIESLDKRIILIEEQINDNNQSE